MEKNINDDFDKNKNNLSFGDETEF